MRIVRHKDRRLPELNMQSLPDLIFTVLFFFMLVTTMRSVPVKVKYKAPEGTTLSQLKKKPSTLYIFVGKPLTPYPEATNDGIAIQVGDRYVKMDQVSRQVSAFMDNLLPDELEQMTVSMKIDSEVPMGIVNDLKMELRKAGALKVHYSALKRKHISAMDKK